MSVLIVIFVIVSLVSFLYYFCTKNFNYWKDRNIVGPKPLPLFGNIKDHALRKENLAQSYQKCYESFPDAPVVGIYRMTSPSLLLRDLDIIKNVMITDFDVFEDRGIEFSKEGLGANLFHSDGDTWRALRHRFTPMFTTGKLKGMFNLVEDQCDKFIKFLDERVAQQSDQEIYNLLKRYTTSTILTCAFGLDVDTASDETMKMFLKIDKMCLETNFFNEIDMMFPGIFKNFASSIFPSEVTKFFEELTTDVIEKRNGKPSNRNDLMDLILEMRQHGDVSVKRENKKEDNKLLVKLTNGVIAAQGFVFYVGGYETTATALAFMLYELALQPEIQNKVIDEIDESIRKHNGKITYEAMSDLPYTEKVFNETYRKYPVVSIQRKSNADYKVPGTSIIIEKDTMVIVSALGIHYDEKYYPNPYKFDPERFNQENSKGRHPCAFLPFGIGPRNCIGMRFAKLQTRILVMKLFSKFRVEPSPKTSKIVIDPVRHFVNPLNGIHLKLIPRTMKEHIE